VPRIPAAGVAATPIAGSVGLGEPRGGPAGRPGAAGVRRSLHRWPSRRPGAAEHGRVNRRPPRP